MTLWPPLPDIPNGRLVKISNQTPRALKASLQFGDDRSASVDLEAFDDTEAYFCESRAYADDIISKAIDANAIRSKHSTWQLLHQDGHQAVLLFRSYALSENTITWQLCVEFTQDASFPSTTIKNSHHEDTQKEREESKAAAEEEEERNTRHEISLFVSI